MPLAVFDIDGTLVAGPSTEKRFFLRLLRGGHIGARPLLAFLWFNLRWLPRYGRHVAKKNKAYLTGMTVERLQAEARAFVAEEVVPALYAPAVARLTQHRAAGESVVLLSGTLQPIAEELARLLDAEEAIGSLCDEREGHITARPPLRHPFGEAKCRLLEEICRRYGERPGSITAYGDSVHDVPVLARTGRPVAVRADKGLASEANRRGWELLAADAPDGMGGARRDTVRVDE